MPFHEVVSIIKPMGGRDLIRHDMPESLPREDDKEKFFDESVTEEIIKDIEESVTEKINRHWREYGAC